MFDCRYLVKTPHRNSNDEQVSLQELAPIIFRSYVRQTPQRAISDLLLKHEIRVKDSSQTLQAREWDGGYGFQIDDEVTIPDIGSRFWCANSCHGLLCLQRGYTCDGIYVCNPILGEYITIPTLRRGLGSVLGFSSISNQFKVLEIHSDRDYLAKIYTIGDGTREWRSIGIAPRCSFTSGPVSFLNGSIHWADKHDEQIGYFDFESEEEFGLLPSPPVRWYSFSGVGMGVSDGCLCMYGYSYPELGKIEVLENWVMKEYGVKESWTNIFSAARKNNPKDEFFYYSRDLNYKTSYRPSFISLQDVAESEHLTVLSKTRTKDQVYPEVISNAIFELWE